MRPTAVLASLIIAFSSFAEVPQRKTFAFTGDGPEQMTKILIPIHVPPVHGAFGSIFYSELYATAKRGTPLLFGLETECPILCVPVDRSDGGLMLTTADSTYIPPNGTPGRFAYVRRDQVDDVAMTLRVYDVSRDRKNYGTAIPVVWFDDVAVTNVAFAAVPTDGPFFRNTLRIYSDAPTFVTITAGGVQEVVELTLGTDPFEPAMVTWTNFPSNAGPIRVSVEAGTVTFSNPPVNARIWALLTVTNNETQDIFAMWPQP